MGELRQRMNDAMVLRGFAERTRKSYVGAVSAFARHYGKSPEQLDSDAIRRYLLHLINDKRLAYSSVNQAICALRFFYRAVLKR